METSQRPLPPPLMRKAAIDFTNKIAPLPEDVHDPSEMDWRDGKISDVDFVSESVVDPGQSQFEDRRTIMVMFAKANMQTGDPTKNQMRIVFNAFADGRFDLDDLQRLIGDWHKDLEVNQTVFDELLYDYVDEPQEVGQA